MLVVRVIQELPTDSGFDKKHTHRAPFNLLLALHSIRGSGVLWEADIQIEMA